MALFHIPPSKQNGVTLNYTHQKISHFGNTKATLTLPLQQTFALRKESIDFIPFSCTAYSHSFQQMTSKYARKEIIF
jgi:hypothetical protein